MAAILSLRRIGNETVIPQLRAVGKRKDLFGRSLDLAAQQAIEEIRRRYPPVQIEALLRQQINDHRFQKVEYFSITDTQNSQIDCCVIFKNAPPNTHLTISWHFRDRDEDIAHISTFISGSDRYVCCLPQRGEPWLPGSYEIRLFTDGDLAKTVPFFVINIE